MSGSERQPLVAVNALEVLWLEREADVAPLEPGVDTVGVVRAGRIAGLAAAVHADHRFALAEVDDQPHRRDQPSVEVLAPAVGRYVQRGVVAAGRIGSAIEIALDRAESGALAGAQVGAIFELSLCHS